MSWLFQGLLDALAGLALVAVLVSSTVETSAAVGRAGRQVEFQFSVDPVYGCHYVRSPSGGATPRLDAEGNHICTGHEAELKRSAQ